MSQLFYQIIYNEHINYVLRHINKLTYPILPKKVKLPPSGTLSLNLNKEQLFIQTNQTCYVTQFLFWEGYENFEYTRLFIDIIKKFNCFYDIGANIGYYSLVAAKLNPDMKIVSFEPAHGPLHFLRKNVEINKFSNITVAPLALSHKKGTIDFYEVQNPKYQFIEYNLAGEGNTGSKTTQRNFKKNTVNTTTLDEFALQNEDNNIDLMKIDTEGTEHLILDKGRNVLENMRPVIICETLFNMIEKELEATMKDYGYRFFNHTPEGLKEVKTIIRTTDDGVRNCFFVPDSKVDLIASHIC